MSSRGWWLAGVLLLTAPAGAGAASVEVSIELCRGCEAPRGLAARVTLQPTGAGGDFEPLSRTIQVPGTVKLEVPDGRSWEASATAAGYWSRPGIVTPGEPPVLAARLELWPAGRVEGELRGAPGLPLPEALTVRFQPAPGAAGNLPRASVPCPVAERRFRCELPAGELDLRLRARGFVSQYRWGVRIPAHRSRDVGAIELKPGASIVGWVQAPGRERLEESRVEIEPVAAGSAAPLEDEARRGWLRQQAPVNSRGFFELARISHNGPRQGPGGPVRVSGRPGDRSTTAPRAGEERSGGVHLGGGAGEGHSASPSEDTAPGTLRVTRSSGSQLRRARAVDWPAVAR